MDFRSVLGRAGDKFRSVFSRDNSFFYGTAEQEARQAAQAANEQAPQQGVYPNAYQQQSGYAPPYQEQQPPYAQPGYQSNPYAYQPQQTAYQQPPQADPYAPPPYQYQAPPQQAYPPPQQQPARGFASPQQAQLQQQAQENTGRNRRAAQHQQAMEPQPESNVVPFPGAPIPEAAEPRQMDAYVVNITNINGCRQAMTCLRKGQCTLVVMDQLVDKAEVRRYVDMLNGACFALGGTMTRLSLKVGFYILAPSGMMVYTDPVTASANAQPRPAQAAAYGAAQPQYAPVQQPNYYQNPQTGSYQPPTFAQQSPPYAPPQNYDNAGYESSRYAQ
ncbi:MAG: cell division protein SepF [Christensenellales bacterium]|jgi:FtsZ-interacting cell division protein YlmF